MTTAHDEFVIKENRIELLNFFEKFQQSPRDSNFLHKEFKVNHKEGWNILQGFDNLKNVPDLSKFIQPISYRPFDDRFIFYEDKLVWRTVKKVMHNFKDGENLALMICRQIAIDKWEHIGITNKIADDSRVSNRTKERGYILPLYLYPETNAQQTFEQTSVRTPNLDLKIVKLIEKKLGLTFTNEKEATKDTFAPIDILDYIYAVLHSPTYREKYKEFLKIDFPRVPYPKDVKIFWQLVKLGGEIRQIHLLESAVVEKYITQYPIDGNNVVDKIKFELNVPKEKATNSVYTTSDDDEVIANNRDDISFPQPHLRNNDNMLHEPSIEENASFLAVTGKVYINDTQYFDNVPEVAWNFFIGGYQPAQKWLKDRKERTLQFDDILHYQKIIVALKETDRLMKEIDKIGVE